MAYTVYFTDQCMKDSIKIKRSGLKEKVEYLLAIVQDNPFQNPPPYEKLWGEFRSFYSRRINNKHRLVYEVLKTEKIVKISRMWSHYGD